LTRLFISFLVTIFLSQPVLAQRSDSLVQEYHINDTVYYYPKPKHFAFITQIPKTYAGVARIAVRKENLKPWAIIAGSTAVLLFMDHDIAVKVQQASRYIGLDNTRRYGKSLAFNLGGTRIDIYDTPLNLNTGIYSIGEGIPPLVISAGLWGFGLIKNDYRARTTASQIVQATLATGVMTQFLKRTTGHESPFRASKPGGAWRPFPKPSVYQKNVSMYDAFPSGHMGTMVSTYVVITENYPEKRWIRPVGISIISLVGLAMINNDVHWASDYPLAIGMGYAFGKATVKLNRFVKGEPWRTKKRR
jgi:hypothetical protein